MFESLRLEWVDPIAGASDLPADRAPAGPRGADELTAAYTDRFAADVAPWWSTLR